MAYKFSQPYQAIKNTSEAVLNTKEEHDIEERLIQKTESTHPFPPFDDAKTLDKQASSQEIRIWLEKHKFYPASARRRGIAGVVEVSFSLQAGAATDIRLQSSSGYSILDQAAIRTVQRAEPFPENEGNYTFQLVFKHT